MKIKKEQLEIIQEQQKTLSNLITNIGILESKKHSLLHEMAAVNSDIADFKKELESEYGQVNINLEDGSYTKIEKELEEVKS